MNNTNTLALDFVLSRNSAFATIADLVADMRRTGYQPSMRCDLDPKLMDVVNYIAKRYTDLAGRLYVYFKSAHGDVVTCWGSPVDRRMALSFRAPETLTKREKLELAKLDGALKAPPDCEALGFLKGWASPRDKVSAPKAALAALDRAVSATAGDQAPIGCIYSLMLDNGLVRKIAIRTLSPSRSRKTGKTKRIEWIG